jgi:hypothetical protein
MPRGEKRPAERANRTIRSHIRCFANAWRKLRWVLVGEFLLGGVFHCWVGCPAVANWLFAAGAIVVVAGKHPAACLMGRLVRLAHCLVKRRARDAKSGPLWALEPPT